MVNVMLKVKKDVLNGFVMSTDDLNKFYLMQLKLKNFRCFDDVVIDFDPRLTVLIAPNGGGKTAVLDAVEIAYRLFIDTMLKKHGSSGFRQQDIRLKLDSEGIMKPMLPLSFFAECVVSGEKIIWDRKLESYATHAKTTSKEAVALKSAAIQYNKHIDDFTEGKTHNPPLLPLLGYYGTGRQWAVHKLTDRTKTDGIAPNSRHKGYEDCLALIHNYKSFKIWFENMSREQQQEDHCTISPHHPFEKLNVVKKAINQVVKVSGWNNLEWDFNLNTIRVTHPKFGFLPVESLSDGIRNMIGLVADIAHRAVRLNPHLGEYAAEKTSGVVLIDEVDMHLNPEWNCVCQTLLDAFPNIQFIVTTNSPHVISTVDFGCIRKIQLED